MSDNLATQVLVRVPPQALDVEKLVLGTMLLDSGVVPVGMALLSPDCFYLQRHRFVFVAIQDLWHNDAPVDLTTVSNQLSLNKSLQSVGGLTALAEMLEAVATPANFEFHCKILRKKATLRHLIHACTNVAEAAYRDEEGVADLIDRAEGLIFSVAERDRQGGSGGLAHLSLSSLAQYEEHSDFLSGIPTGFEAIDRLTNGLHRGDLFIIAARPSMGKTALALSMAERIALRQGRPVGFFSLEMSKEQLAERMLCGLARLNSTAIRRVKMPGDGFSRLVRAGAALEKAPIMIDDTPALSESDLRSRARRLRAQHRVDVVFVDYMQLMEGEGESRQQEITKISRSLKTLAKELAVPVVALSQLNRSVETRGGDKRPQLSDLRESGAIEQDADVVAFVYRESAAFGRDINNRGEDISGLAEIIIAKHRSGPTGVAKLAFIRDLARFEDLEKA